MKNSADIKKIGVADMQKIGNADFTARREIRLFGQPRCKPGCKPENKFVNHLPEKLRYIVVRVFSRENLTLQYNVVRATAATPIFQNRGFAQLQYNVVFRGFGLQVASAGLQAGLHLTFYRSTF